MAGVLASKLVSLCNFHAYPVKRNANEDTGEPYS